MWEVAAASLHDDSQVKDEDDFFSSDEEGEHNVFNLFLDDVAQ